MFLCVGQTLKTVAVLIFLFQMDPSRISKEDAHCVRMLFRSPESIGLQDTPFENQDMKLMPESCRRMKQALQRAVQKVSSSGFSYFCLTW